MEIWASKFGPSPPDGPSEPKLQDDNFKSRLFIFIYFYINSIPKESKIILNQPGLLNPGFTFPVFFWSLHLFILIPAWRHPVPRGTAGAWSLVASAAQLLSRTCAARHLDFRRPTGLRMATRIGLCDNEVQHQKNLMTTVYVQEYYRKLPLG